MKRIFISLVTGLFLLTVSATTAMAASDYIQPFAGQQKVLSDNVAYLSGGVGIHERAQMDKMDKGYNLRLVFDANSGEYLANVGVSIAGENGNLLVDAVSSGPWFFAKLPAGTYRVTGTFNGRQETRTVTVGQHPDQVIMNWKV